MTGVTPQGIRYPDGATKAKELGSELRQMALDLDKYVAENAVRGPRGPEGPQGLPGATAIPTDEAVAAYVATEGTSATQTALDGRYGARAIVDSLAEMLMPQRIDLPDGMGTFTDPFTVTRRLGGSYSTGIDAAALHTPGAGPTYYVDPINGNNANTGLSMAQAFKDAAYAALKNSSDASTIICKGGVYVRSDIPSIRGKNVAIKAAPGEKVIFTACDRLTSWTASSTPPRYRHTLASANGVLDLKFTDSAGLPQQLQPVVNFAAVLETPGSWYFDGTAVFVHLSDGRAPDANVLVSRPVNSLLYQGLTGSNVSTYLEGIEFWGGTTANLTASGDNWRLYAKRCKFLFANATNGLSVLGVARVVLQECEASHNHLDGFNYHESSGRNGQVIEVDCTAHHNGKTPGSNNGSTAHDQYKIARVGGYYDSNTGANIADVNTARSFNVGVSASNSTEYGQDFYGANMWLDGCFSRSPIAFEPQAGGTIRVRSCLYTGETVGNVVEY